jgi:hypothetical protein
LRRAEALELTCLESVLTLELIGLGGKAGAILNRCQLREVFPLLHRQRTLLQRKLDTEAAKLDQELAAAWDRCAEQLHILWLTEGQSTHEETEPDAEDFPQ